MTARAYNAYTAGRYEDALSYFSQLTIASGGGSSNAPRSSDEAVSSGVDFRMLHNLALTEHAARGFTNPSKLEAALHSIEDHLRGSARTDGLDWEEIEGDKGHAPSNSSFAAKTTRTALVGLSDGAAAAASAPAGLADLDADASVLLYNLSALHFHQKQYGAAQAVLEHLFRRIEPLDDSLAIHVCLLLLDVLCHSARGNLHTEESRKRFAAQSAAVLAFLDRPHVLNSSSGGAGDSGGGSGGDSGRHDDGGIGSADQTEFAFRLHLYKAKILLLQQQTKTSKKEIKSALEIFQRELRRGAGDATGGLASGPSGTGIHHRQYQQEGEHQGTFAPVPRAGVQNMAALYLKANLEYLRNNHRKALKLLASCHGFQGAEEYSGPGEAVGPPYFNNMGCLHHKLRRHHVALHYFQKALQALGREEAKTAENGTTARGGAAGSGGGSSGSRDGHVSPAPICEVLYNTGLQLLITENPEEALRCFERAALLFHNRPHLWLRMAECSITHYRLRNIRSRNTNGGGWKENESGSETPSEGGSGATDADAAGGAWSPSLEHGGEGPAQARTPARAFRRRRQLCPGRRYCWSRWRRDSPAGRGQLSGNERVGDDGSRFFIEFGGGRSKGAWEKGTRWMLLGSRQPLPTQRALPVRGARAGVREASAVLAAGDGDAGGPTGFLRGQAGLLGVPSRAMSKGATLAQHQQHQHQQAANNDDGDDDGADVGGGGGGGGVAAQDSSGEADCYQVALIDLAYVHLGLNDPVAALSFSGRVLLCKPSPPKTRLAHLYAAEALCLLGRPSEALEHLMPLSEDTSTAAAAAAGAWSRTRKPSFSPSIGAMNAATTGGALPGVHAAGAGTGSGVVGPPGAGLGAGHTGSSTPEAAAEARASLHANLAAVYALQGNILQAERCARTALGICPGSAVVLRMVVYVLLRQGNIAEALQVLKEGRLSHK